VVVGDPRLTWLAQILPQRGALVVRPHPATPGRNRALAPLRRPGQRRATAGPRPWRPRL